MDRSESIKELAVALAKAQGLIGTAAKDTSNPFFHSNYADLASIWGVARKPLSENGLSVIQIPDIEGDSIILRTMLLHSSGEFILSQYKVNPMRQAKDQGWVKSDDPQSIGSALTYARRYALAAMVGIVAEEEDDDGEGAMGRGKKPEKPKPPGIKPEPPKSQPEPEKSIEEVHKESETKFVALHERMTKIVNGIELQNWWKKHNEEIKALLPEHREQIEAFKNHLKEKFANG